MRNINLNESVWQIATTKVITVFADTPIEDIKEMFKINNFHHIPVVDTGGLLKGIISSADLIKVEKLLTLSQFENRKFTAEIVMTAFPFFLNPDDTIMEAIELFVENRFHALPIVEDGILTGIVTTHDILEMTLKLPELVVED